MEKRMPPTKYQKPRLTIEVTEHQQKVLNKYLPHGMKKKLFGIMLDDIVQMLESHGVNFIVALLLREVDFKESYLTYVSDRELDHYINRRIN